MSGQNSAYSSLKTQLESKAINRYVDVYVNFNRYVSMQALWQPDSQTIESSQMHQFQRHIEARFSIEFADYTAFHTWSIEHKDAFWEQLWQYCDVIASQTHSEILQPAKRFQDHRWFPEAKLNFAENLLRFRDEQTAIVGLLEDGSRRTLSYAELYQQVASLAARLRELGVEPGDRVAAFMPNVPETVIGMLAATAIGALWSSCSPDFGINGVLDRFGQIEPKVLIGSESYLYNGKQHDCLERLQAVQAALPSLERTLLVSVTRTPASLSDPGLNNWEWFEDALKALGSEPLEFEQLPFDHPLYILYSSGTTGKPKCIVHGAGGTLLQHLKEHRLHTDIRRDDVLFYFTTCGWMMWNWLVSGLASGCTVVLYDGSPFANNGDLLLDSIDREGISVFGTSAKFISALEQAGKHPAQSHELKRLRSILSTGSPLSHESFRWVYDRFKSDVCLSSICGGTDIVSCFMLGNPCLPVYEGQLQCIGLGMAVEVRNEKGDAVREEKGELVCTQPFPSCPVSFWNDPEGERFHKAYFDLYDNTWAQGDYAEITPEGGVIVHGRSDAVLNPGGVRIGTAEIYRQLQYFQDIKDAVVVGQNWKDDVRVVLCLVMEDQQTLSDELIQAIKSRIRSETTPRHVPSKVIQVSDIPRTISGKIAEIAVRDTIHGERVGNLDALANPESLESFKQRPELAAD